MKRVKKSEKLALKVETVRSLENVRPIDDKQLNGIAGGRNTGSGCASCSCITD